MDRYIAHLIGHPVQITLHCGCTSVRVVKPGWVLIRCGIEATIESAEKRLRCKTCGQRARLKAEGEWGFTGGRDQRIDPPKMPDWVDVS